MYMYFYIPLATGHNKLTVQRSHVCMSIQWTPLSIHSIGIYYNTCTNTKYICTHVLHVYSLTQGVGSVVRSSPKGIARIIIAIFKGWHSQMVNSLLGSVLLSWFHFPSHKWSQLSMGQIAPVFIMYAVYTCRDIDHSMVVYLGEVYSLANRSQVWNTIKTHTSHVALL